MTPEDAYSILEAIAEIHGFTDRLKKIEMNENEMQDEQLAQDIENEYSERASNFSYNLLVNRISIIEGQVEGGIEEKIMWDCFKLRGAVTYGKVLVLDEKDSILKTACAFANNYM